MYNDYNNRNVNNINNIKKHKYQLIYPIFGNKIYHTTSLKGGAQKCYDELKYLDVIQDNYFIVLNIDTNETYKFKIDKKFTDKKKILIGGKSENKTEGNVDIESQIGKISDRLDTIEQNLSKIISSTTDQIQRSTQHVFDNPPAYRPTDIPSPFPLTASIEEKPKTAPVVEKPKPGPVVEKPKSNPVIPVKSEHVEDLDEHKKTKICSSQISSRSTIDVSSNLIDDTRGPADVYNLNLRKLYETRLMEKEEQEEQEKTKADNGNTCTLL